MKFRLPIVVISCAAFLLASCSVSKQISKQANEILLKDTAVSTGHLGISIYEPATNKYWYNHEATKYFVPASNTKLFTLYAGMKYLGDTLVGLEYTLAEPEDSNYTLFVIRPTGDPTFLHPDFTKQPVFDFLKTYAFQYKNINLQDDNWRANHWGNGWAWNDYDAGYMAERNSFPIYGNLISITLKDVAARRLTENGNPLPNERSIFKTQQGYFDSLINRNLNLVSINVLKTPKPGINIIRKLSGNDFSFESGSRPFTNTYIPFVTNGNETTISLLTDTLKQPISLYSVGTKGKASNINWQPVYSHPSDSLFKPMMHNSDNFFAEQTLLMASNIKLGYMDDAAFINQLIKTELKDLPQKPRWVDGSGLSRYNMFTPQSFVYILHKMQREFGMKRMKNILPTGGEGTLSAYYKKDSSFIYAKTGTLTGHCALSGYLFTKKGKVLIFSLLANHYQSGATPIRKAFELFLKGIREKY